MDPKDASNQFIDEEEEWLRMTPAERIVESGRLWAAYIALGGSLDPEPDPQSPFYVPEASRSSRGERPFAPTYRRSGVHRTRTRHRRNHHPKGKRRAATSGGVGEK